MVASWASYRTPTTTHRRLGLCCLGVGVQRGVVPCGPRTLPSHAAVLLTAGRGRLQIDAKEYALRAPVLFWLAPQQRHRYGPDRHGWAESWVLFDGPATAGYAELGYLAGGSPVTQLDHPGPVRRAFGDLVAVCRQAGPDVDVQAALGVHQLLTAIRQTRGDLDRSAGTVLTALRRDAMLPLSVSEHARRLGRSTDEVRATVRARTGFGVKEYLLQIRLTRAKELLAVSRLPVGQVAREVGYADAGYFTRLFTRRVGVSPTEFRAQLRQPAESDG
jgi:AraC-like DNA-binding protein